MFVQQGFIPIPRGARPGFDHADVFQTGGRGSRVYVAHTGADRVDMLDGDRGAFLGSLPGLTGVAGVLVEQRERLLLTTDRGANRLSVFALPSGAPKAQVAVGARPNGVAYDRMRRRAFVFNIGEPAGDHCTASVVSLDEMAVVATLALPGRPRWAVFDVETDRVYANVREPAQIVVISARRMTIIGVYDVPAAGPHGLAVSGDHLFCAGDAGELVKLARATGRLQASARLSGEPDVIWVDEPGRLVFVAIGDPGVVDVIDRNSMRRVQTIETGPGAHTTAWDPRARQLFAFEPSACGAAVFGEGSGRPTYESSAALAR